MKKLFDKCILLGVGVVLQVVTVAPTSSDNISFTCTREGRYINPYDCGAYVTCVTDGKGGLTAQLGSCHGGAFDEETESCVAANKGRGCSRRQARLHFPSPELNYLCENSSVKFTCGNCKKLVSCVEGKAHADFCPQGSYCTKNEAVFGGAACFNDNVEECSCEGERIGKYHLDPTNKRAFYFCDAKGAYDFNSCRRNMVYDLELNHCINENGLPSCKQNGFFINPQNCSQYYNCIDAVGGFVHKVFSCTEKTLYNEVSGECEDPCTWEDGKFHCRQLGRFGDIYDCNKYVDCVAMKNDATSFTKMQWRCPNAMHFNGTMCIDRSVSNCKSLVPSSCGIPEGWCTDGSEGISSSTTSSTTSTSTSTMETTTMEADLTTTTSESEEETNIFSFRRSQTRNDFLNRNSLVNSILV